MLITNPPRFQRLEMPIAGLCLLERCTYHLSFLYFVPRYPNNKREYHYRALKDIISKNLISREDWSPPELDNIPKFWSATISSYLFRNTKIQLTLNPEDLHALRQRLVHKPRQHKFITKEEVNISLSNPY